MKPRPSQEAAERRTLATRPLDLTWGDGFVAAVSFSLSFPQLWDWDVPALGACLGALDAAGGKD